METKTIITKITKDDLVNLFSTATYGSSYFDVAKKKKDYYGTELEDENDCREYTWAKILLAGKTVYVFDYYSEEVAYGNLPHEWDEKRDAMRYTVTLDDIKKGLQKAIDNGGWDAECAFDLINDDSCNLDLTEAENLLQIITFGEAIYG